MSLQLPFGIELVNPAPVDVYYGPYIDLPTALASLPSGIRYQGQTVGVFNLGVIDEYWFKSGTTDPDLVVKTPDLSPYQLMSEKAQPNGYASLDGSGKVPQVQMPAIAITDTFVVASQVAMLSLTAETGDVAVRTDLNKSFILAGTDPTVLGDWQELLTPTGTVLSVNGNVGAVNLGWNDILSQSRITNGINPFISAGDAIEWHNTTASFTTTLTNDQATAANRTIYLPKFDGQLAYSTADLTSGYATFATTNGALTGDSNFFWDNSNKRLGIGTSSPSNKLHLYVSDSGSYDQLWIQNANTSNNTGIRLVSAGADEPQILRVGGSNTNINTNYQNSMLFDFSNYTSVATSFNFITYDNAAGNSFRIISDNTSISSGYASTYFQAYATNTFSGIGIGLGSSNPTARLHVKGSTSDSTAYALKVDNSSSSALLYIENGGYSHFGDSYKSVGSNWALVSINPIGKGIYANLSMRVYNSTTKITGADAQTGLYTFPSNTATTASYARAIEMRHLNNNGQVAMYNYYAGVQDTDIFFDSQNVSGASGNPLLYMDFSANSVLINYAVGTTAGATLDINGNGKFKGSTSDSTAYALKVDNSSSSALLYVRNDGRVSIGTATPNGLFVVRSASGTEQILFGSTSVTDGRDWRLGRDNDTTGDFLFKSSDAVGATTTRLRVTLANGYVAIGSHTPTKDLDLSTGKIEKYSTGNNSGLSFYNTSDVLALQYNSNTTSNFARFSIFRPNSTSVDSDDLQLFATNGSYTSGIGFGNTANTAYILSRGNLSNGLVLGAISGGVKLYGDNTTIAATLNGSIINLPSLQIGNAGLSSKDLYKDTAANILANGDYVIGMKA